MSNWYKNKFTNATPVQVIGPTTLGDGTTHQGSPYYHPDRYVFTNTSSGSSAFSMYYKITSGTDYYLMYKQIIPPSYTLSISADEIPYDSDNFGLWIKVDSGTIDVTIKMK